MSLAPASQAFIFRKAKPESQRSWRHIGSPAQAVGTTAKYFKPANAGGMDAKVMPPAFAGFLSSRRLPTACAVGYRYAAGFAGWNRATTSPAFYSTCCKLSAMRTPFTRMVPLSREVQADPVFSRKK
jgi:hypothetical protein